MACAAETELNCTMPHDEVLKAEPLNEDIGEIGTEDNPQGRIFKDAEVETVAKTRKNEGKKEGLFTVKISKPKIGEKLGGMIDLFYNIVNDNPVESQDGQVEINDDEDEKA